MAVTITRTTDVDDSGTGTDGTIHNAAWKTEVYDQIDTALASVLPTTGGALTGLLDLSSTSAGQIKFPASQNASADANTLDDYEEGAWTPVLGGSGGTTGQTYATQAGSYIKTGKQVSASCVIALTTKGTITNYAQIQGLPFVSQNTTSYRYAANVAEFSNLATSWAWLTGYISENDSAIWLEGTTAAVATVTPLDTTAIANNTGLYASVVYRATA